MLALPFGPLSPWLAPLAGYSDLPFRLLCREQGAACACTEMVSAKGLVYGLKGKPAGGVAASATEELLLGVRDLKLSPGDEACDEPLVVQLFGDDPEFLGRAVEILLERGFAWFDLNLGCSVPKVTRAGAGAALLRDPERALKIAKAMLDAAGPGRVGFKLRLGWDKGAEVYEDLALALQDLGAGWITLHPRYARQFFSGRAAWPSMAGLAQKLRLPLIASGDLFCGQDAVDCLGESGASTAMFARGAMNNPAVFSEYLALAQSGRARESSPEAQARALKKIILRHAELTRAMPQRNRRRRKGRAELPAGLLKMRSFVPRYVRRLSGVRGLRNALASCESWEAFYELIDGFFEDQNRK